MYSLTSLFNLWKNKHTYVHTVARCYCRCVLTAEYGDSELSEEEKERRAQEEAFINEDSTFDEDEPDPEEEQYEEPDAEPESEMEPEPEEGEELPPPVEQNVSANRRRSSQDTTDTRRSSFDDVQAVNRRYHGRRSHRARRHSSRHVEANTTAPLLACPPASGVRRHKLEALPAPSADLSGHHAIRRKSTYPAVPRLPPPPAPPPPAAYRAASDTDSLSSLPTTPLPCPRTTRTAGQTAEARMAEPTTDERPHHRDTRQSRDATPTGHRHRSSRDGGRRYACRQDDGAAGPSRHSTVSRRHHRSPQRDTPHTARPPYIPPSFVSQIAVNSPQLAATYSKHRGAYATQRYPHTSESKAVFPATAHSYGAVTSPLPPPPRPHYTPPPPRN